MAQEGIQKSFQVSSPARLKVVNIRGSINLTQGEKNEIEIKAKKIRDCPYPEDTTIEIFQADDGTVNAFTRFHQSGIIRFGMPCKVEYEILAPHNTTALIKTVSGSVMIEDIDGKHKITSVSGTVEFNRFTGKIAIRTVSGKIKAARITGPAMLRTVSGSIQVAESSLSVIRSSTVSGQVIIHSDIGEGPYHFISISGSTKLIVPTDTKCTVQAQSVSGRFRTDLNTSPKSILPRSWEVDLAGGGTEIFMKSVSGNLSILTHEREKGEVPRVKRKSRLQRTDILQQLESGDLTV
jgi:hypothetical protein